MENELNKKVLEELIKVFSDDIKSAEESYGMLSVTVSKNKIYAIIKFLKDNSETNFNFLTDLTGIHLPENKEDLGVIYHLHNFYKNHRIRLKIFFSTHDSYVDSIVDLYSGANWMERETFDFFGIHFKGHPNLTRILNMEDMLIHPLRKEFPLEDQSRKDKNDAMFGR
ncbi:MAG: NADH-quinone oxidoreductase subunit C [Bacteroidota bacterium]